METTSFGSTYEGLKLVFLAVGPLGQECFGSTYEGLKRVISGVLYAVGGWFWQYL